LQNNQATEHNLTISNRPCIILHYYYYMNMKIFQLAAAAVIATSTTVPTIITAQPNVEPITCSCTPNAYRLSLNFDGTCSNDNTDGSDGIDGSICFFTQGGSPNDLDDGIITGPTRRRRLGNAVVEKNEEWVDTVLSKVDFINHIQHAAAAQVQDTRQLESDSLDTTPTKITSVTFLETDTTPDLNIINQDSTYFDIDGNNGDILEYTSISSSLDPGMSMSIGDQLDKVPGGVILVLFGENAAGEVIQNRVAWGYVNNYCEDDELLAVGSGIGWLSLSGFGSPSSDFCPAVPATPPTPPATTEAPPPPATTDGPMFSKSSKSKSGKETTKSSKTEKMSMPSAKSKKGDTKSSKLMKAVSHLAAISGKLYHFIYYNF